MKRFKRNNDSIYQFKYIYESGHFPIGKVSEIRKSKKWFDNSTGMFIDIENKHELKNDMFYCFIYID